MMDDSGALNDLYIIFFKANINKYTYICIVTIAFFSFFELSWYKSEWSMVTQLVLNWLSLKHGFHFGASEEEWVNSENHGSD